MSGQVRIQMELGFALNARVPIGIDPEKVREIPLTKGLVAIVDADDYERLSQWKWCIQGRYAVRSNKGHMKMHRIILGIQNSKDLLVDHINRNPLDNRKLNLRIADYSINGWNSKMQSNNTSGYRGVCSFKGKWQADIHVNMKLIYLGRYSNIIDAALAYDRAVIKYRGADAPLNFPERIGEDNVR